MIDPWNDSESIIDAFVAPDVGFIFIPIWTKTALKCDKKATSSKYKILKGKKKKKKV